MDKTLEEISRDMFCQYASERGFTCGRILISQLEEFHSFRDAWNACLERMKPEIENRERERSEEEIRALKVQIQLMSGPEALTNIIDNLDTLAGEPVQQILKERDHWRRKYEILARKLENE